MNGQVDTATDIAYISRALLGLEPVPSTFRRVDPTIPSDAVITAHVAAIGAALDIDFDGHVDVATDIVYICRSLLGLAPVPPGMRLLDPAIPPDTAIAARIAALCP